jgi:hypothetical protein
MEVFLAGIMQGSMVEAKICSQDWREPISRAILRHLPLANIYCHYSRHRGSIGYELESIHRVFEDGVRRASECDVLVAYLPSASMGTAIEMHEASRAGAAIVTISPMAANWVVRAYSDAVLADIESFGAFVAGGGLCRLLEAKGRAEPTLGVAPGGKTGTDCTLEEHACAPKGRMHGTRDGGPGERI